jgi:hypothetical protein
MQRISGTIFSATSALVCLLAAMAHAGTRITVSEGGWDAFGGTTTVGISVCGISNDAVKGRYFGVKLFANTATFTIQLANKDWEITKGSHYEVRMQFDHHDRWYATGEGIIFNDGDSGIEYTVRKTQLAEFEREFSDSARLRVWISQSDTPGWVLDVKGVRAVKKEFATCNRNLG